MALPIRSLCLTCFPSGVMPGLLHILRLQPTRLGQHITSIPPSRAVSASVALFLSIAQIQILRILQPQVRATLRSKHVVLQGKAGQYEGGEHLTNREQRRVTDHEGSGADAGEDAIAQPHSDPH